MKTPLLAAVGRLAAGFSQVGAVRSGALQVHSGSAGACIRLPRRDLPRIARTDHPDLGPACRAGPAFAFAERPAFADRPLGGGSSMAPLFHSRVSRVRSVDLGRQNGCRNPYIDPAGARIRLQETFGSIPGLHHPVERRGAKATRPPGRLETRLVGRS